MGYHDADPKLSASGISTSEALAIKYASGKTEPLAPLVANSLTSQQSALANKELQVRILYDSFSAWSTTTTGSCTIDKANASDYYPDSKYGGTASTCAVMTTDGVAGSSGSYTSCRMTITGIGPLDLTDTFPVLAIKVTDWAAFKEQRGIQVYLFSGGGTTDYSAFYLDDTNTGTTINYVDSNGTWILVPFTWSRSAETGGAGATRTAITGIRIRIYDRWGGSGAAVSPAQVKIGMIGLARELYAQYPNGLITLCFDDGRNTVRSKAFPILDSFGIRATFYPITAKLGYDTTYLSVADVDWLVARGWEAGLHAYSDAVHVAGLPATIANSGLAAARADVEANIAYNAARGWNTRHLAYPHGLFDRSSIDLLASIGIRTARTTIGSPAISRLDTYPQCDPLKLSATPLANDRTLANMKTWMDTVKAHRLWGIMPAHQLITGPTSGGLASEWNIDDYRSLILYGTQLGISFRSLGQLLP